MLNYNKELLYYYYIIVIITVFILETDKPLLNNAYRYL